MTAMNSQFRGSCWTRRDSSSPVTSAWQIAVFFGVRPAVDQAAQWLAENRHHRILPEEKPAILDVLKQKPVENLFAIGDLENFSLDDDFFDALALYKYPSGQRVLESLVIRYHHNLILALSG